MTAKWGLSNQTGNRRLIGVVPIWTNSLPKTERLAGSVSCPKDADDPNRGKFAEMAVYERIDVAAPQGRGNFKPALNFAWRVTS